MNYLDFNPSSRPTAMGSKGMATSAHPLASLAGINVLNKGGNAFDAIVAIASTLNVQNLLCQVWEDLDLDWFIRQRKRN